MAALEDVLVYSLAAGVGTIGIALTGFGMAIVYLFVYQMAVLIGGYQGDFKYAIFIQALALLAAQPWLLRIAEVRKNADVRMLWYFVPATIISTPLGQISSTYISSKWIKAVGGVLILLVASFEVFQRRQDLQSLFLSCCRRNALSRGQGDDEASTMCKETDLSTTPTTVDDSNNNIDIEVPREQTITSNDEVQVENSSNLSLSDDNERQNKDGNDDAETTIAPLSQWAKCCTFLAGFLSGFLGALAGIRGPPVIFYFLYPPAGVVFTKETQRASAATMTAVNVLMRTLYYIVDTAAMDGENFLDITADWNLYVSVVVSAIAGVMTGAALFERTKDMKQAIRTVLTGLLFICGTSLILSAFAAAF